MNVKIRNAALEDNTKIRILQEEIARLHYDRRPDLFKNEARYYSNEAFKNKLDNPEHFIYIAENESGEVVGYAFANIIRYRNHSTYNDFDSFYIDDICVDEENQRHGIGKLLFKKCKEQAIILHCHNIDLGVYSFNKNAIAFYESCEMSERLKRMELVLNTTDFPLLPINN